MESQQTNPSSFLSVPPRNGAIHGAAVFLIRESAEPVESQKPDPVPPTSTVIEIDTDAHKRAWRIEDNRLVINHEAEGIRHVLQSGMVFSGDMELMDGLAFGGLFKEGGTLSIPNGTLIVMAGAKIHGRIEVKNLYNLGAIDNEAVRATGLLVNWGTLHARTVEYGALESAGDLEAESIRKIR